MEVPPHPHMQHRVMGDALPRVWSSSPRRAVAAVAIVVPSPGTPTVLQWRPTSRLLGCPHTNGLAHG
jgi:hypothetical protein